MLLLNGISLGVSTAIQLLVEFGLISVATASYW